MPGKLTVCPTPIGNLGDISGRARDALANAAMIACEDTRRTGRLLELLELEAPRLVSYHEQNWTVERYSGGGMISHAPPGVLTEFGPALREPCGRIHWAGTESSAIMCGWIDGAVRSGERAASEVMALETAAVA